MSEKVEVKIPAMGESVSEAVIAQLLVEQGQLVAQDAEILEIETDKVNQVLYAPAGGKLEILVDLGQNVSVGQIVARIDTSVQGANTRVQEPNEQKRQENQNVQQNSPQKSLTSEKKLEKKLDTTKAYSVDSAVAKSTLPACSGARVDIDDFLQGLQANSLPHSSQVPSMPVSSTPQERVSSKRMPKIRQVIAQRLHFAKLSTAMLTTFNEVDMSAVMEMRKLYKEEFTKKHGVKLGFMSFFVKAVVDALKKEVGLNSYIEGDELKQRHFYDISIAVGTDRGLVVPVLRNCDQKNFAQIEREIVDFAQSAKTGTLKPSDMEGGCFTITNGGVYGSLLSTPILNPPQSGILGMHKIQKRAVVVGDEIVIRPMMYLALSYDHRIVDGKEAVSFLVHIKEILEDPRALLLDL